MALPGWSEKRNYKLEPDRFRQGRGTMSDHYDLPICMTAPVKIFHCTQVSQHDLQIYFQGV
jgi:hypothetical protein